MRPCLFVVALTMLLAPSPADARILTVGDGQAFACIADAATEARPGDTIAVFPGVYPGGQTINDLQGNAEQWILISGAPGTIIEGGSNALHLRQCAYLRIRGIVVRGQTGNGVNIDDAGSFATPTHDIVIERCEFRDMNAEGNNDLLKLSGLDDFTVRNCRFINGATGGSGIDMVGCHRGLIKGNRFENMGSNCIQAKGGTQHVRIEANFFKDGGNRSLNLGGSTGLQFFRPQDAPFEAADLQVYANVFVGSQAPIAYVGSVRVEVVNNTIVNPGNWVVRILQETVDPDRFFEVGDNVFRNNIVYIGQEISRVTNIGPNTRPESFTYSNNLWFNALEANWQGPDLPVQERDGIVGEDPLFMLPDLEDFSLLSGSPAIGNGVAVPGLERDYDDELFNEPPSIGAFEGDPATAVGVYSNVLTSTSAIACGPLPFGEAIDLSLDLDSAQWVQLQIFSYDGRNVYGPLRTFLASGKHKLTIHRQDLAFLPDVMFLTADIDGTLHLTKIRSAP